MRALILLSVLILFSFTKSTDFLSDQRRYVRVKNAYNEKEIVVAKKLQELNLELKEINILMVAYKAEKQLDLFVKKKSDLKYTKLNTYNICETSGKLGPKRKQGDNQTPEGFYYIDRFNPTSKYYLSLGINYPNQSDRIKSEKFSLGGDIFIHGDCVTKGCLPMTNDKIKEIYIYAIQARQNGQLKIPVYIFPFRFTEKNVSIYFNHHKSDKALVSFWGNLRTGYDMFQNTFQDVKIKVDHKGNYSFSNGQN